MQKEDKPLNIIYLGSYSNSEILIGPEKVAKRIFDNLSITNNCTFIEYFFDGKKYSYYKKFFGKEIISDYKNKILKLGIFRILFALFKIKPDILHIITFERFAAIAFLYKLLFNVKFIFNIHGVVKYENKYIRGVKGFENIKDKICEYFFMNFSDILLFLSEDSVSIAKKYYKINDKKVRLISNGIDEIFYNVGLKRQFNNNKALSIVFIADAERKDKGFDFLKMTLEQVNFELNLFIVSGKADNNIIFDNTKIKFNILNLMSPEKLSSFLIDKDIFISASNFDSFGISSIEAIATGIVPILTLETGASRFIKNGENGFIVKYGDVNKLLEILKYIKMNPQIKEIIYKNNDSMYDTLSWNKISEMYKNIYQMVNIRN